MCVCVCVCVCVTSQQMLKYTGLYFCRGFSLVLLLYGISTLEGNLLPNPVNTYALNVYDLV